jgi:hypothetical protein
LDAARTQLWTARWSRKQRAAVFALGLLMFYLHSLYILRFYVSEDEYWWPVWTEMTVARSGGCSVPVRGHSREGGKVEVAAHCRAAPAA